MAKGINQKGKILYLEKILRETSETHPCTMQEIIGRLQENGVSAERKSIYDDMEVLRSLKEESIPDIMLPEKLPQRA